MQLKWRYFLNIDEHGHEWYDIINEKFETVASTPKRKSVTVEDLEVVSTIVTAVSLFLRWPHANIFLSEMENELSTLKKRRNGNLPI